MLALDGSATAAPLIFDESAPVHFSDLKCFALSPAHYRAARRASRESTRDMRVGTVVHHLVLVAHRTKPLIKYEGDERKGNVWKDFERASKAKNPTCEIVTAVEWADAEPIAAAVMADPIAAELLRNTRREVSVKWTSGGVACETDGIDAVGPGYIIDLKRTSCAEPGGFSRHATKQLWHAQMAMYEEAANENKIDTSQGLFLIGVEPKLPYAVTCLQMTPPAIEHGRKCYVKWLERLQVCRAEDHWPSYVQTVVPFELPDWLREGDDDDG